MEVSHGFLWLRTEIIGGGWGNGFSVSVKGREFLDWTLTLVFSRSCCSMELGLLARCWQLWKTSAPIYMHFKVNRTASAENGQMPLHLYLVKQEKMSMSAYFALPHTLLSALDGDWSIYICYVEKRLKHGNRCVYHLRQHQSIPHYALALYLGVFILLRTIILLYRITGWFS